MVSFAGGSNALCDELTILMDDGSTRPDVLITNWMRTKPLIPALRRHIDLRADHMSGPGSSASCTRRSPQRGGVCGETTRWTT